MAAMTGAAAHVRRNAVAYLALFVALGGTSYAVVALPRGSVGTRELKASAVTSAKVKNGALRRKDFKRGVLLRGRRGATGPQGPTGATGAPGSPGPSVVTRATFTGDQPAGAAALVTMANGTWTQAANEIDQFFGRVTIDNPSTAQCGPNHLATLDVRVGAARFLLLTLDSDDYPSAGTAQYEIPATQRRAFFEPGTDTPRALTVSWKDDCTGTHFRLRNAQVDVVGIR